VRLSLNTFIGHGATSAMMLFLLSGFSLSCTGSLGRGLIQFVLSGK
jgi:hypothetical protein